MLPLREVNIGAQFMLHFWPWSEKSISTALTDSITGSYWAPRKWRIDCILKKINPNFMIFLDNCSWLARTDPKDVARVESKTVISTPRKEQVVPNGQNPTPGALPNWMSINQLDTEIMKRFPNCMKGKILERSRLWFHKTLLRKHIMIQFHENDESHDGN